MTKIVQFSTIGALMSGHMQGEEIFSEMSCGCNFGLGCSAGLGGELTVFDGTAFEATAGQAIEILDFHAKIPFIQLTKFRAEHVHNVADIDEQTVEACLNKFIELKNIFLAVSLKGIFHSITIRRPQPASESHPKTVQQIAAEQQVDSYDNIEGRLVGFWTPELFGRVSVPGFHFHFIDQSKKISGHVLKFSVKTAELTYEEKQTIEITNSNSQSYKKMDIDIGKLDDVISHVEK